MSAIEEFFAGRAVAQREVVDTDTLNTAWVTPFRGRNVKCGQPDCAARATKLVISKPCNCSGRFCVAHAAIAVQKAELFRSLRPAGHPAQHPKCGTQFVVGDWRLEVIAL